MKQVPVFYFEKHAYEARIKELETTAQNTNDLLSEFNRLKLFPLKTMQEITALISGGETYIKKRLEELVEPQKVGTLAQDPAKVVATLSLPDFTRLNELIGVCKPGAADLQYLHYNGEKVTLQDDRKDRERKSYTKEADTPERLGLLNSYNEAVAAMQKFHKALRNMNSAGISGTRNVDDYFIIEGEDVRFKERFFIDNYKVLQPKP